MLRSLSPSGTRSFKRPSSPIGFQFSLSFFMLQSHEERHIENWEAPLEVIPLPQRFKIDRYQASSSWIAK